MIMVMVDVVVGDKGNVKMQIAVVVTVCLS
jgi:hypothetical protein